MKPSHKSALMAVAGLCLAVGNAHASLIGQWNFTDGGGTVAQDSVGNNNGTLSGNVAFVSGALSFTGGSVALPSSVLSSAEATQQATFAAWIDPTSFASYNTIFDDPSRQFSFWINSTTGGFEGTQGFGGGLNFSTPFQLNVWQYLAVTYIAGTATTPGVYDVYLNGVLVASAAPSGVATFSQVMTIGGNTSGGGSPFLGEMKDVQFYDNALTLGQVQALAGVIAAPEPSTLAVLGAGLAGLGALRRRAARKRRAD
jgi:hypothetical protein